MFCCRTFQLLCIFHQPPAASFTELDLLLQICRFHHQLLRVLCPFPSGSSDSDAALCAFSLRASSAALLCSRFFHFVLCLLRLLQQCLRLLQLCLRLLRTRLGSCVLRPCLGFNFGILLGFLSSLCGLQFGNPRLFSGDIRLGSHAVEQGGLKVLKFLQTRVQECVSVEECSWLATSLRMHTCSASTHSRMQGSK